MLTIFVPHMHECWHIGSHGFCNKTYTEHDFDGLGITGYEGDSGVFGAECVKYKHLGAREFTGLEQSDSLGCRNFDLVTGLGLEAVE